MLSKRGNARAASVPSKSIRAAIRIQQHPWSYIPRQIQAVATTGEEVSPKGCFQVDGILRATGQKDKGNEEGSLKTGKTKPPG